MAGQALPDTNNDSSELVVQPSPEAVKETAAKLYGAGMERAKIARAMVNVLVPRGQDRPLEQRLSQARTKLRNWEAQEEFRNMIYRFATIKLDMATPSIFQALIKQGKKGRVDASRLVLELTGRHNPKGEQQPTQVVVAINGMPRPVGSPAAGVQQDTAVEVEDGEIVVKEVESG